ncbi:HypC/HybG/HupF family hydrogenase formation chaperone [Ghiorsea bivora]|uniref:HypC/HybG/HupF family hydrogenase formation chaperone n=1 Tax=Ghiorsea bivora TaxID=1485545 RepID=UPI00056E9132|nr:HypC/HybG/HupF family hydrogenase formation chaperone [Ghiorsea bivora]
MCLGIPMQVVTVLSEHVAYCQGMGKQKNIDMSLVGEQPVGTWVMTFLDAAREVVDEDKALQVTNALEAVNLAMGSDATGIDELFADIIDRGPQLPPHLQTEVTKE